MTVATMVGWPLPPVPIPPLPPVLAPPPPPPQAEKVVSTTSSPNRTIRRWTRARIRSRIDTPRVSLVGRLQADFYLLNGGAHDHRAAPTARPASLLGICPVGPRDLTPATAWISPWGQDPWAG